LSGIEHGVAYHSWTQTFAPKSKAAEQQAEDEDQKHPPRAFVSMSASENECGENQADVGLPAENRKLPLQIAAKDNLFDEAGNHTQQDEYQQRVPRMGSQHASQLFCLVHLGRLGQAQGKTETKNSAISHNKKTKRDRNIEQDVFKRIPTAADDVADFGSVESQPDPDQKEQEKFKRNCRDVLEDAPCFSDAGGLRYRLGGEPGGEG